MTYLELLEFWKSDRCIMHVKGFDIKGWKEALDIEIVTEFARCAEYAIDETIDFSGENHVTIRLFGLKEKELPVLEFVSREGRVRYLGPRSIQRYAGQVGFIQPDETINLCWLAYCTCIWERKFQLVNCFKLRRRTCLEFECTEPSERVKGE